MLKILQKTNKYIYTTIDGKLFLPDTLLKPLSHISVVCAIFNPICGPSGARALSRENGFVVQIIPMADSHVWASRLYLEATKHSAYIMLRRFQTLPQ